MTALNVAVSNGSGLGVDDAENADLLILPDGVDLAGYAVGEMDADDLFDVAVRTLNVANLLAVFVAAERLCEVPLRTAESDVRFGLLMTAVNAAKD